MIRHHWKARQLERFPINCAESNYKIINWDDQNNQQARATQLNKIVASIGTMIW